MSWDITGYNAGGRRPLTNGLRASKFRGMGSPHYLQANTYIQNNYYGNMSYSHMFDCHAADYNCFGGGGMSNTGKWMFGLGAIFSAIGNMFGAFMPQKEDGVGDAPGNGTNTDDDLKNLRTLYPDYNIVKMSDGKYYATPKDGGDAVIADTAAELPNKLKAKPPAAPAQGTEVPVTDKQKGSAQVTGTVKREEVEEYNLNRNATYYSQMMALFTTADGKDITLPNATELVHFFNKHYKKADNTNSLPNGGFIDLALVAQDPEMSKKFKLREDGPDEDKYIQIDTRNSSYRSIQRGAPKYRYKASAGNYSGTGSTADEAKANLNQNAGNNVKVDTWREE